MGDAAHIVGVDIHEPYLEFCTRFGLYDELIHRDAATHSFGQFDIVTACEVVEHIQAEKSAALLHRLEQIATELMIVSTPNGEALRGPIGGVKSEAHVSTWTAAWFKRRDYRVCGVGNRWYRFDQAGRLKICGLVRVNARGAANPLVCGHSVAWKRCIKDPTSSGSNLIPQPASGNISLDGG